MFPGFELEIFGELKAWEAGLAFELDLVEGENGVLGGAYEEMVCGKL